MLLDPQLEAEIEAITKRAVDLSVGEADVVDTDKAETIAFHLVEMHPQADALKEFLARGALESIFQEIGNADLN